MRIKAILVCMAFFAAQTVLAESPRASMKAGVKSSAKTSMKTSMKTSPKPAKEIDPLAQEALDDIKATLGLVPDFFRVYPEEALPGAWQTFKNVQLNPNSAIPSRYKELIGLAVSSQIPCHYCTYFHTEAAKVNGATDREIREAIALAGIERQWSTVISGTQSNMGEFKSLTRDFVRNSKKEAAKGDRAISCEVPARTFKSAEAAYADIEYTLGDVPDFVYKFPKDGIAGAWSELKALVFSPNTAIPSKYKDLITLAVSAQVPCEHCIFFDTEIARLDGASEDEINEAIAMSSMSRHWSTVLNGLQTNEATFKKQMSQIFAGAKKKMAAANNTKKSS